MKQLSAYFSPRVQIALLGLFTGVFVAASPYLFSCLLRRGFTLPGEYYSLLGFGLIVIPLLMYLIYLGLRRLSAILGNMEVPYSYIFLLLIFIHIFLAGFRLDISNYILIFYLLTFSILLALKKIDRIIITPIFYFIIAHFIICNISLLTPHSISVPQTYSSLLKLNIKILVVFLVLNSLMTEKELRHFFRLYIVLCIFTSLVATTQAIVFFLTGINYSLAGPDVKRIVVSPIGVYPRVSGFFKHPTVMATDISPMFIILLYSMISPEYFSRRKRTIILCLLGVMLIPVFLATARGTWVAMFFGCLTIFFLKKPHLYLKKIAFLAILFFISYITGLLDFAYDLLVSLNEASVSARYSLFQMGLAGIRDYPILGYGIFNFENFTGNYTSASVHSSPFQIWSETGIIGLITYECIIAYIIWRVLSQLRRTAIGKNRFILEAYFAALVTVIINNFFQQITWATFTFLLLALGEAITRIVIVNEEVGRELNVI